MNVVVAIDSFKGSLNSIEAGESAKRGITKAIPNSICEVFPLADGGEGTMEALTRGMGGEFIELEVTGPLGDKVMSTYGMVNITKTAIIEMAQAAGITLVPTDKRNPMVTTTYGVGEIIIDAIKRGCRQFIIGIGGSATNDGGVGMLCALGFSFLDSNGNKITPNALGLKDLSQIIGETKNDNEKFGRSLDRPFIDIIKDCRFTVACDVNNPLCGEQGCSYIFGPQKGANKEMVQEMDHYLRRFADKTKDYLDGKDYANFPGAGAAGGLGFAFLAYLNAELKSGIDIVLESIGIEEKIRTADIVVTGEGRLDAQTVMGKAPIGVARLAKKHDVPVVAFSGCLGEGTEVLNQNGIDAFFPIIQNVAPIEELMDSENAKKNMESSVEQVFRLLAIRR